MTYVDLDQQPDAAHMADWGKNIQSYIIDEKIKHAKLHWEASCEEINDMGSWRRDIAEVLETHTNNKHDEIKVLQK